MGKWESWSLSCRWRPRMPLHVSRFSCFPSSTGWPVMRTATGDEWLSPESLTAADGSGFCSTSPILVSSRRRQPCDQKAASWTRSTPHGQAHGGAGHPAPGGSRVGDGARADLNAEQYHVAWEAYGQNRPVILQGILRRGGGCIDWRCPSS